MVCKMVLNLDQVESSSISNIGEKAFFQCKSLVPKRSVSFPLSIISHKWPNPLLALTKLTLNVVAVLISFPFCLE